MKTLARWAIALGTTALMAGAVAAAPLPSPPRHTRTLSLAPSNSLTGRGISELAEPGMKNAVERVLRIPGYGA